MPLFMLRFIRRGLYATLLLLPLALPAFCQVDTLKSAATVEAFVKRYSSYKAVQVQPLAPAQSVAGSGGMPPGWLVGDVNHDGINDLVVTALAGESKAGSAAPRLLVLASEKGRYRCVPFENMFFYSFMARSAVSARLCALPAGTYLVVSVSTQPVGRESAGRPVVTHDTVYVRYGRPMLYTAHPQPTKLRQLTFATSGCYGACPVFELTLSADRTVSYNGLRHVSRLGAHNLLVDQADLYYLNQLLSNLHLDALRSQYAVPWTDDQTSTLTVTTQQGQTKTIGDYGMKGTFGLAVLYQYLLGLRNF